MKRFCELFIGNVVGTFAVICAIAVVVAPIAAVMFTVYIAFEHLPAWLAWAVVVVDMWLIKTAFDWREEQVKRAKRRKEYVESVGGYPEL